MSGAIAIRLSWIVVHHMDIVELLNGYSIAVRIQISGIALTGLRCILQLQKDAPKLLRFYSCTRRAIMPRMTMAGFHYTAPQNGGTSMSLDYCSNTMPM
jgi:hypothetical protein